MIEETKIQKAFAWILFVAGCGVGWLVIGESITHIICDVFNLGVHQAPNTERIQGVVAIITIIAGAQGGTKWIQYKREKDCVLPRKEKLNDNISD